MSTKLYAEALSEVKRINSDLDAALTELARDEHADIIYDPYVKGLLAGWEEDQRESEDPVTY